MSDILSGVTTSEAVTTTIGLQEIEFTATDITNAELDQELELDLMNWLPVSYATIVSDGTDPGATDEEKKKYFLLRIFAKNFIAHLILSRGILGVAQQLSDGQNVFQRNEDAFKNMAEAVLAAAENAKDELLELYGTTTDYGVTVLTGARNNYDPVTNETES